MIDPFDLDCPEHWVYDNYSATKALDTYGHSMTESQRKLGEVMGDWFDNAPNGLQKAT